MANSTNYVQSLTFNELITFTGSKHG